MLEQDTDLIIQLKNGDQTAFAELYRRHIRYAFGTAILLVKDSSTASDVCQEAFIKVYKNIKAFKEGNQFKPWFYRIIVNEAMRLTRRIMVLPRPTEIMPEVPSPAAGEPQNVLISKELSLEIRQEINKLPAKFKIPIILRYYTDLAEDEVASISKSPWVLLNHV